MTIQSGADAPHSRAHRFTLRQLCAKREHVRWAVLFLLAVGTAPISIVLALYARWWWAGGRGTDGERLPLRWLVVALAQEVVAMSLAAAGTIGLRTRTAQRELRPPCRAQTDEHVQPDIVFLAGGAMEEAAVGPLLTHLNALGWSVAVFRPTSWRVSIADTAAQLDVLLRASDARPGRVLIAYGAAGLTLRYYLRRYPAIGIRRAVTIATPHQGSKTPFVAFGSPLPLTADAFRQLAAGDRVPQQFDTIAIYSDFDAFIAPADSAYYPGAFNVQVRGVGHFALARSPRLFELLGENLGSAPPRPADTPHARGSSMTSSTRVKS